MCHVCAIPAVLQGLRLDKAVANWPAEQAHARLGCIQMTWVWNATVANEEEEEEVLRLKLTISLVYALYIIGCSAA